MSKKILAATIIIAATAATAPFYLSGKIAEQALYGELQRFGQSSDWITIDKADSHIGLYRSTNQYNIQLTLDKMKLDQTLLSQLQQLAGGNVLTFSLNNQATHGFMKVNTQTTFSGTGAELVEKYLQKLHYQPQDDKAPRLTVSSDAKVSWSGSPVLNTHVHIPGFKLSQKGEDGENAVLESTAIGIELESIGQQLSMTNHIDKLTLQTGDSTMDLTDLKLTGQGRLAANADESLMMFASQDAKLTLNKVTLRGPKHAVDLLVDLDWRFKTQVEGKRAVIDNQLTASYAKQPNVLATPVEDLAVNFTLDMGLAAMKDYYRAIKQMESPDQNPQQALSTFSRLLSQDIHFKLTSAKAKTADGQVDFNADVNIGAIDPTAFQSNPRLLVDALKFNAKGELPRALAQRSVNLTPEIIDNLLNSQMLEAKDKQLLFDMSGEKGHLNLSGKPLF